MGSVVLLSKFGRGEQAIFDESGNLDLSTMGTGSYVNFGGTRLYLFTSAITPNSTTTSAAAGSLAVTSNATGLGSIFQSDGSKWQLLSNYTNSEVQATRQTIATTSTTVFYVIAPQAATIESIDFVGVDALAAHGSNYLTFSALNLGQAGAGSTALLAATDANTTKTTTGTAITAKGRRSLTLTGTAANLVVAKGDVIEITATATGTLANTVSGNFLVRFNRLS